MRIWVDLTNSPHVLVMRPVIAKLRARGHDVDVTARDFAQTLGLLQRFGIEHTTIGRHRGSRLGAKARGLGERSAALARWARGQGRPGAVDERLIAEGRLRRLTTADELDIVRRGGPTPGQDRVRRDPGLLTDLLLGA